MSSTDAPAAEPLRRKLVRPAVFAVVALVAAFVLLPKVPRSQQVRLHLGIGSSHVVAATARIGRDCRDDRGSIPSSRDCAWDRETTWRFDRGAPPSVEWSFDLANGPAQVEVELQSATASDQRSMQIDLRGGESDVELDDLTRGLAR